MLAHASNLKASESFWAAVVVAIGTGLVLASLLGSYGVATSLGLGWQIRTFIIGGLVLLWGPIILIVTLVFVSMSGPVISSAMVIWRNASFACLVRRRPNLPSI